MKVICQAVLVIMVAVGWESLVTNGEFGCCENEAENCDCKITTTTTYSQSSSNVTDTEVTYSNGTTRVYTSTVNVSRTTTESETKNDKITGNNETSPEVTTAVATTTTCTGTGCATTVAGTTTTSSSTAMASCKAVYDGGSTTNGVYEISVGGSTVEVYCEQELDGGGWLVFQRRYSGDTDFYLDWSSYKNGFGNKSEEYWLGLETLYDILQTGDHELRVDLGNTANATKYAKYEYFDMNDESNQYAVTNISGYTGDAGDSLGTHLNANFTTRDSDNDQMTGHNCAILYTGAWWYKQCYDSNLNGEYGATEGRGVVWNTWHTGSLISSTSMKIRPK